MTGRVERRHALLPTVFRLPEHLDLAPEFVVDTGFTGELTRPPETVAAMELPYDYDEVVNLANNTNAVIAVHSATVLWQGIERNGRVFATGQRPPLGTGLLDGCELVVQFAEGGLVTLDIL